MKSEHLSYSPLEGEAESLIRKCLLEERAMIEDPSLPISSFNYSAIRERLQDLGFKVSLPTIIERAKALGCHQARPKKKAHSREVITTAVGALIQHDASLQLRFWWENRMVHSLIFPLKQFPRVHF